MKNIAVLISGNGSNLQAVIDAQAAGRINGRIVGVLSNTPAAFGLQRAKAAGIATAVIAHANYQSRSEFDAAMQQQLQKWRAEIVVLAGFMRILSPEFVRAWHGKMLNVHPSLLPKYRGLHTHQRALDAGDKLHGSSIHFVTEELDGGPIVLQAQVNVSKNDSAESLADKVQQVEHRYYPEVICWLCSGQLVLHTRGVYLNGDVLDRPLVR